MVLQSAVFRSSSVSRTLRQPEHSHQEEHMVYHCWNSYTGFLFVTESSTCKLAILTFEICRSSTPAYLARHIRSRQISRHLCSSDTALLHKPITRTHFADHAFCCTAPTVWNSPSNDVLSLALHLPYLSLP